MCAVRAFGLLEYLGTCGTRRVRFRPLKTRVLTRKAHGADVRGAGLWPTGVHEAPWNATREVPHPLKRGFSSARRPEAMRTGVREPLENAADEVPQLTTCGLALQDREART